MIAPDAPMTAAEFRALRESLGITSSWLAAHLEIAERTGLRWEYGRNPLPAHAIAALLAIADETDTLIDQLTEQFTADPTRPLVTYRTDDEYRADVPNTVYPASWHRAAAMRVMWQHRGARLVYHGAQEGSKA